MKPMHFAMALLSAVMFFILAGVFMGMQLELDGTKLVVDTAADIRWQWIYIGTAVVFFFQLLRPVFQKTIKNVSGPKFILPAIDGSTVKQKLFLIALLVIAVAWPFMVSRGTVDIATLTMIYIILGLGLNVVVGLSGLLVLGYGGFYAIGAYTFALLNHYYGLGFWTCLPLAGLVSAAAGFLLGFPVLRLRGDYLAIITLGFGEIIRVILTNIDSVIGKDFTYGAAGLKRIPKYSSFTLVFICAVVSCYIIHTIMKSRHGRAILSIREDEIASESVGVQTTYYKTFAFVVSAMLAGIAGCLYAGYIGSLYPSTFKFMKSIEILVMVVLGGMGSMLGSILSATVLTILPELLRSFSDYRMVVYSLALVVMMIFRPKGLLGSYDFSLSRSLETFLNRLIGRTENPKKEAEDNE